MKTNQPATLLSLGAFSLMLTAHADALPVLTAGHTDVGVNFEADAWDLHVHAEDLDEEYEPDGVWLKVPSSARSSVPSTSAFQFLGSAGDPIWVLPAIQKPDLLFLGLGTEELAPGVFENDTVQLTLKRIDGPGQFLAYQTDALGTPVVFFDSCDGISDADLCTLAAGGHTHVNWVFTAPGKYRIGFQASGTLVATGSATTSEVAEYLFDVGEIPKLSLTKAEGQDHLHLHWRSETNASYQVQFRAAMSGTAWTDLGSPIAGTGNELMTRIETAASQRFFRVLVNYDHN